MTLNGLITGPRARTFQSALAQSARSANFSLVEGLRAPLIAGLLTTDARPRALLAITATGRESEALARALECYLPSATVVDFPAWETLPHERLSASAETVGKRIAALRAISAWQQNPSGQYVLAASVRAALQPLADNLTSIEPVMLTRGGRGYNLADLSVRLVDLAYSRVDMVTRAMNPTCVGTMLASSRRHTGVWSLRPEIVNTKNPAAHLRSCVERTGHRFMRTSVAGSVISTWHRT